MPNPDKHELKVTQPSRVKRIAIEGIGERDQVWVHLEHLDGTMETYFNYLDEGYTVVLQQIQVIKDAILHEDARVLLHYSEIGSTKRFHAVTMFMED